MDGVFEALGTDPAPAPGGLAGHFHVGTDGTRVLNYAEWASAQAHIAALAAPGDGVGSRTPHWERMQPYPGVTGGGVRRCTPALSLRPGEREPSGRSHPSVRGAAVRLLPAEGRLLSHAPGGTGWNASRLGPPDPVRARSRGPGDVYARTFFEETP